MTVPDQIGAFSFLKKDRFSLFRLRSRYVIFLGLPDEHFFYMLPQKQDVAVPTRSEQLVLCGPVEEPPPVRAERRSAHVTATTATQTASRGLDVIAAVLDTCKVAYAK